ncbi:MAG: hypothetical protein NXH82_02905 [Rhodobacteraceae bacterium]|nr:hypothetical protein [Paracoccaceae bacterium]
MFFVRFLHSVGPTGRATGCLRKLPRYSLGHRKEDTMDPFFVLPIFILIVLLGFCVYSLKDTI